MSVRKRTPEPFEWEVLLEEAFGFSPIGMALVGLDGRFLKVNESLCTILGYTCEDLLARTFQEITHPDDLEADLALARKLMDAEIESYELEKRYLSKGGKCVWAQLNISLVRNQGRPQFFVSQIQDITKRREAEAALKETQDHFAAVCRRLGAIVWSASADGTSMLDLIGAIEDIYGTPPESFRTDPGLWLKVVHPDDREVAETSHRELINSGWSQVEYRIVRPDETVRWVRDHKSLIHDRQGAPVRMGGLVLDITEIKNEEAEKSVLQAQFIQAQKMEAVGRLAGGVAHDFNNMLTVILGCADISIEKLQPSDLLYGEFQEIRRAARRSAELTRQLLAFSRQQAIEPRLLDLNESLEGTFAMLERLIGEDIAILWKPVVGLWHVKMDPSQLDQILANLVVNARDAIPGTGNITIETANVILDEAYCAKHQGFVPGNFVMLSVSDNGSGISKEHLEKVFEPFFTTKELGRGTGLGLATVYGVVKQNGGFINIYSEVGLGTTVRIYLPPAPEGGSFIAQENTQREDIRGRGETILLVEDESQILQTCKTALEGFGYKVLAAGTVTEALQLVKDFAGAIDLVVTDVVMPEMNGKELGALLQSIYPDIRCLFMSGYSANVVFQHGILEEGISFIQKPFGIKELRARIREVLDSC